MRGLAWGAIAATLITGIAACASAPERYDATSRHLAFERSVVAGAGFEHVVYSRHVPAAPDVLHVYLDSDGLPWRTMIRVSDDPTPREPLALELAALDPAPSILLGRACYHGLSPRPPCEPRLWTDARYSEPMVASLAQALSSYAADHGDPELVLIGYSGGGTLAMLLAARVPRVRAVVTIAGNLDVAAWARLHGYTPLAGSLDPAQLPPLKPEIRQLHLAGGRDTNVPLALIESAVARQPDARLRVMADYDHRCCWLQDWPAILRDLGA